MNLYIFKWEKEIIKDFWLKMEFTVKEPGKENVDIIHQFLIETDRLSIPPRSHRFDLLEYAMKLQHNATLFEFVEDGKLVALNAVYVNKYPKDSYATSLAVLPEYEGYGLGARLILKAINYCKEYGSEGYRLQMRKSNAVMLDFYLRRKFSVIAEENYPGNIEGVILKLCFK